MVLDDLPVELPALAQPVDTWFSARRLGTLLEARVGAGRIVVCSMDLRTDLGDRPVAELFRHNLVRYLTGPEFDPQVEVTARQVRALFR